MKRIPPLAWICALFIAFVSGYFLGSFPSRVATSEPASPQAEGVKPASVTLMEIRDTTDFPLVKPLLSCDSSSEADVFMSQGEIDRLVHNLEEKENISKISVYFRNFSTGEWIGVRETESFNAASLKKVPLAVAAFVQAEREPGFLDRKVTFALPREGNDPSRNQAFPPAEQLESGRSYTVLELINRMLRYSDNESSWLLLETVNRKYHEKVYRDVGLAFPDFTGGVDYALSNEQYGRFFRLIYNATYLNPENSERLAEIMTRSTFTNGIVAGLPAGTLVAHKFGERGTPHGGKFILQLHDSGIVYNPRQHYLLSIMTMGEDFKAQGEAIATITRYVDQKVGTGQQFIAAVHPR